MRDSKKENTNKIIALGHIGVGGQKGWIYSANGICPTIPASTWKDPIKFVHNIRDGDMNDDNNKIKKVVTTRMSDISSTIRATIYKQGERNIMKNIENGSGYEGIIEKFPSAKIDDDGTVFCKYDELVEFAEQNKPKYRVRKLTPTECWKLMGLTKEDIEKAKAVGVSDSQLYKQAGNGIVTNCVELLAEHLYKAQYDNTYKCTDENFIFPQQ